MKEIPQRTIHHVVIEQEISIWRQSITMQAHNISVSNAANGFKFSLKLSQVVRILIVKFLNCYWSGILQCTFVNSTRCTIANNILLTQILSASHYIIKGVNSHIHVQNHKLGWSWVERKPTLRIWRYKCCK